MPMGESCPPMRSSTPIPYAVFAQRVRQYRRSDVLRVCAQMGAEGEQVTRGFASRRPGLANYVQPFSIAGVARTALAACNEYRTAHCGRREVEQLCGWYVNVDEPDDGTEPGTNHLRQMLARLAYEQFPHQLAGMETVGRSIALFEDRFQGIAGAPTPDEWRAAFGASVADLVLAGFVAYASACVNGGRVLIDQIGEPELDALYEGLTAREGQKVLESFFCADLQEVAQRARELERAGREKWSPSPLAARPVVRLASNELVVPWPHLVVERFSPSGLFYAGIEFFGDSFGRALGQIFELYVGDQLRLLPDAVVTGEQVYLDRGSEHKTCDWFVVTDACVVLVEVKATRPVHDVRTGSPDGLTDIERKVGRAASQLERTARLVRADHPAVGFVPKDRPLLGLVVTLEPFYLLDTWLYDDVVGGRELPVTVASSHEFEAVVAGLLAADDVGPRLIAGLTADGATPSRLLRSIEGVDDPPSNPILSKAWDRILPTKRKS